MKRISPYNKRGPNAVYTADDCFSSGLDNMEPGKCYALNPDRGTQHGWINNNAQDGWWWVEKPCGGDSNRCSDDFLVGGDIGLILNKKSINDVEDQYYEFPWRTSYIYDALGRKTYDDRKTRRFLFNKKTLSNNNFITSFSLRESFEPVEIDEGRWCGEFGVDYGITKNGIDLIGGITCSKVKVLTDYKLQRKGNGTCENGESTINISGNAKFEISLGINKIYYIQENDGIPIPPYITNKEMEIKMCKHEVGHRNDHARVVPNRTRYVSVNVVGCGCDDADEKAKIFIEKTKQDTLMFYETLMNNTDIEYHKIYNGDGAPSNVSCPN